MHKYKITLLGASPEQVLRLRVEISTALLMEVGVSESPYIYTVDVGHEKELRVVVSEYKPDDVKEERIAIITLMGGIGPSEYTNGCLKVTRIDDGDEGVSFDADEGEVGVGFETLKPVEEQPLEDLQEPDPPDDA